MKKFFEFLIMMALIPMIAGATPFMHVIMLVLVLLALFMPARKLKWYEHAAGVSVILANGQLGGTLQTNDGISGMVLTGVDEDGYSLGDTLLITGLDNLAIQGITEGNNPLAYKQVKEFYDGVGDGALLYLMLVPNTMTVAQMCDNTNAAGAKKLLQWADGKIKLLGVMSDDAAIAAESEDATTITHGLNAEVYTAAANLKIMAAAFFELEKPFRAIIGGTSYNGTAADLTDETSGTTNNRIAIIIGDTVSGINAALGLVLGRAASIPVQRKISRIKDGPLTNTAAYLGTATLESTGADQATIAGKGFITFKTVANLSGYFWSSDPMLTATTDDYQFLCRGRVIDKAHILAYAVFVQEVDDEVPINDDGTINSGFAKWLEQQIINAINTAMVAKGECSAVDCFIDTNQNIVSTNTLNIVLKVRPVAYATDIVVTLGFEA